MKLGEYIEATIAANLNEHGESARQERALALLEWYQFRLQDYDRRMLTNDDVVGIANDAAMEVSEIIIPTDFEHLTAAELGELEERYKSLTIEDPFAIYTEVLDMEREVYFEKLMSLATDVELSDLLPSIPGLGREDDLSEKFREAFIAAIPRICDGQNLKPVQARLRKFRS